MIQYLLGLAANAYLVGFAENLDLFFETWTASLTENSWLSAIFILFFFEAHP
jgi:hypothetical protein